MFALLLFACTAGDDTSTDDTGSHDTAAADDTGSEIESCLAFHGIRSDSSRWIHVYEQQSYTPDSSYTIDVIAYDADAGTATLRTVDYRVWVDGSQVQNNSYDNNYWCDADGLHLESGSRSIESTNNGTVNAYTQTLTYDPPMFVRPGSLAVGDTWVSETRLTIVKDDGTQQALTVSSAYEVGADGHSYGDWSGLVINLMVDGEAYPRYFQPSVGEYLNGTRVLEIYTP